MVFICWVLYVKLGSPLTAASLLRNETDHLSLLAFKAAITEDPFGVLSAWNHSVHFCQWAGIICGSRRKQRVVSLNLNSYKLSGVLSPHIGNLSFLKILNLSKNAFTGEIPTDVGRLFRLQVLELANNTFEGEIPVNLSNCSNIEYVNLAINKLEGRIPLHIGSLEKMYFLELRSNNLTGSIPNSLGNLSSLESFDLTLNNLIGTIPPDLTRLQRLSFFSVAANLLKGTIPHQLYNISSIYLFSVSRNQHLQGTLPWDIGQTLPNLEWLAIGRNLFTGTIPVSLLNCSQLSFLEFFENMFTGPVPQDLGRLQHLWRLTGHSYNDGTVEGSQGNNLQFLSSLINCTDLQQLDMFGSALTGTLPISIANLSFRLEQLDLSTNYIHGSIPSGIANLVSLKFLALEENNISSHIPDSIGKLQGLQVLQLYTNRLTGAIPSSLGNLTQLSVLALFDNKLDGTIPPSLGNCQNLIAMSLSSNNLTGPIPAQLFEIPSLFELVLDHNYFTGPLPLHVCKLNNLVTLYVSDNKLSGDLLHKLEECVTLSELFMNSNEFEGKIPASLSALKGIEQLDLSHNKLSGTIPEALGDLPFLNFLDLSFNDLEGAVPQKGKFRNASAFKVDGNHKLCGGISKLRLPSCPTLGSRRKQNSLPLKIIAPVIAAGLCLILLACFVVMLWKRRTSIRKPYSSTSFNGRHWRISYAELVKATNSFSEANLLGVGSYSSVYKGLLEQDGMIVAVKVLNLQQHGSSKSFTSECKSLRTVRHRNLIKILTSCSSTDFQGNDFKALVFDFMPNGNLEKWLHPEPHTDKQGELWNISHVQRLNIAIDVASALDHLHNHSQSKIIHCDLKPSNVLLDSEMTAHVGDFGLSKIISSASYNSEPSQASSFAVKGSIGYVAPEYGLGSEVSTQGDVYSYGILLLEMFTGKRPTHDLFRDGLTLHSFVNMSLHERVVEIIDPRLLVEEDTGGRMQECLVAVLKVGIACSMESPNDRMEMKDVVKELNSIRAVYQQIGIA